MRSRCFGYFAFYFQGKHFDDPSVLNQIDLGGLNGASNQHAGEGFSAVLGAVLSFCTWKTGEPLRPSILVRGRDHAGGIRGPESIYRYPRTQVA